MFKAAPFRKLSPHTKKSISFGYSFDTRILPTTVGSVPTTSIGVGKTLFAGSSVTKTPAAFESKIRTSSAVTSRSSTACTANEWVVTTGTRTQVAWIFRVGFPKIFRDSFRTLISSLV